jgi:hypothetical protein
LICEDRLVDWKPRGEDGGLYLDFFVGTKERLRDVVYKPLFRFEEIRVPQRVC